MVIFYLMNDENEVWFFTDKETAQKYINKNYDQSFGGPSFTDVVLPRDGGSDFIFKVGVTHFFWSYSEAESLKDSDSSYLDPIVKIPVRRHGKYYVIRIEDEGKIINEETFWCEENALWRWKLPSYKTFIETIEF